MNSRKSQRTGVAGLDSARGRAVGDKGREVIGSLGHTVYTSKSENDRGDCIFSLCQRTMTWFGGLPTLFPHTLVCFCCPLTSVDTLNQGNNRVLPQSSDTTEFLPIGFCQFSVPLLYRQ